MTSTPNLGLTQYAGTDTMNFLTQYSTDLDKIDDYAGATNAQLAQKANQTALDVANANISSLGLNKADKSEVTNVMTPKGNIAYASLPTAGNIVGYYYYCPDGDGTHGDGNYVWNGTSWYFGGTGDQGYNKLKTDLVNQDKLSYDRMVSIFNDGHKLIRPIIEIGAIDLSCGLNADNEIKHVRTKDMLYFENGIVYIHVPNNIEVGFIWYNSDNSFNSFYQYQTSSNHYISFSSNNHPKYRVSFHKTDNTVFTDGDILNMYIAVVDTSIKRVKPWRNKNVVFLGDSITIGSWGGVDGQHWSNMERPYPTILKEELGLRVAQNYGQGGTHISSAYKGNGQSDENSAFTKRMIYLGNDGDMIVVAGGTNDYGHTHTAPFGSIADTTDISFYGALNYMCNYLTKTYLGKRIVFMTPLQRNDGDTPNPTTGKTLKDYCNAIKEVCALYSIKVIDNYNEIGFYPSMAEFRTAYMEDGLHPNPTGQELLGKRLVPIFNTIGS